MAGRPQKPTNLLQLQGAYEINPGRLKDRPAQTSTKSSIGKPPAHWTLSEGNPGFQRGQDLQKLWRQIRKMAPWLVPAQRLTLEHVCVLQYRSRNETLKPSELNLLRLMSNSLGLDGVGKAPVAGNDPGPSEDPRDAFERRRG